MAGGCVLAVCLLAALSGCLRAQETSEQDLYGSSAWQADSSPLVVINAQEDAQLLQEWLQDTHTQVAQVKCEAASESDLCTLLSSHSIVVKKEGHVLVGVAGNTTDNSTVVSVMENLLGPEFHLIPDYNAMRQFQETHSQHMLAYARSNKGKTFDNYLYFLKALLTVRDRSTHVAVTKQPLALPLSHRPKYTKSIQLYIWLVSDGKWCQYTNSTHPSHIVNGIAAFYRRMRVPFQVYYTSEELTTAYKEMGLFTSYVIHSPGKKSLAERAVSQFIETYCNFFMFLIAEKKSRKNRLTKALYLSPGENNIIVIEPPISDMPPIHLDLDGIEEQDMQTMLAPIQEEYMEQYIAHPETGRPVKRRRKVVITDPWSIGHIALDAQEDMLVAFCDGKDMQVCGHFENSLQKVADIITTSAYQRQEMGFAVVHCTSLEEVRKYGVEDYPHIAYYNSSSGQWAEVQEKNFQNIIARALGQPEESEEEKLAREEMEKVWEEEQKKFLKDDNTPDKKKLREAEKFSREYRDPAPPDDIVPPNLHDDHTPPTHDDRSPHDEGRSRAIIDEDDHFGQLLFSLGAAEYPKELVLSDETFTAYINSHTTSLVTFYVPWEPHCDGVMHYMLQALEDIPEDSRSSVSVVNCADYPDLCAQYSIVHYPTVLLFRASPSDWVPYQGMMDSRQILRVLLQQSEEREEGLPELRADTLPLIIGGSLSHTVLVVWASEGKRGGEGEDGIREISALAESEQFGNFSFSWMNCKEEEELLMKVFSQWDCESLLIFDFQKRSVYQLSPNEWVAQESLSVAIQDFLSHYLSGTLAASGHLTDWSWPPLQPPIKFPSTKRSSREPESHDAPPLPPSSPPSPPSPPSQASFSPSPHSHHSHTEL